MTSANQETNIVPYRKKKYFNIGLIIFGIIFIYLVAAVIMYLTAPHITSYEVHEGSILKDNAYTGLALREETIIKSTSSGYINYCAQNASKVRTNSSIYALSNQKLNLNSNTDKNVKLTDEEQQILLMKIQNFNENFRDSSFSETYLLKNEIESMIQNITSQSKLEQINALLTNGSSEGMTLYPTPDDGIVVYSIDGMESLTPDTVTIQNLVKTNYEKTEIQNNTKINAGDPVYKLITSEDWFLLTELSDETASALSEKKYVKVKFIKDNQTFWAGLEIKKVSGKKLACLSFDNSMIRYASERYLDIELILEDQSGLKIPKTAVTTKDFFVVPKSYLTTGGNSSSQGVLKQVTDKKGVTISKFFPVKIYYEEEESETVYLNADIFKDHDTLIKPNSTETLTLRDKKKLKGVYNINKGYATFKQINILTESEEYYIVKKENSYGLSNYDHIALDSKDIKEDDVIF